MEGILFKPIGIIRTPHKEVKGTPIQPFAAKDFKGTIELNEEFVEGLKDIEGFSHITLFYYFHKISGYELQVTPFMDEEKRGIFACKAPKRPNPIGLSTVKLIKTEGNIIYFEEADMLDNTPLLDIKPFYPKYDNRLDVKTGWLENKINIPKTRFRADERFK